MFCLGVSRGDDDPIRSAQCSRIDNASANPLLGIPMTLDVATSLAQTVTVSDVPVNLYATLQVWANDGYGFGGRAVMDLSHTATLGLQLPDGVSFTSDSGLLLQGTPAPVPEPSTALAALAGLALLLARRFRPRTG